LVGGFLFSFSEDLAAVIVFSCDIFEAYFYELADFFGGFGDFCVEGVVCGREDCSFQVYVD